MKITFVTAPYDIIQNAYGVKRKVKYGYWAPFSLAVLAACCRAGGHTPEIVDSSPLGYGNREVIEHLKKSRPDVVGLQSTFAAKEQTLQLLREIKSELKIPVFLGGWFATSFQENLLKENPELDFVFVGEAEKTIVSVLDALEKGRGFDGIRGQELPNW